MSLSDGAQVHPILGTSHTLDQFINKRFVTRTLSRVLSPTLRHRHSHRHGARRTGRRTHGVGFGSGEMGQRGAEQPVATPTPTPTPTPCPVPCAPCPCTMPPAGVPVPVSMLPMSPHSASPLRLHAKLVNAPATRAEAHQGAMRDELLVSSRGILSCGRVCGVRQACVQNRPADAGSEVSRRPASSAGGGWSRGGGRERAGGVWGGHNSPMVGGAQTLGLMPASSTSS